MKPMSHRAIGALFLVGCTSLAACIAASAQVVQPMGSFPRNHRMPGQITPAAQPPAGAPAQAPALSPVSTPVPTTLPSLLDQPAQPARVDLTSGHLVIQADNSSLADILHHLTADSGMAVDGLGQDQRIFGSYGPGDPQEVLMALLDGSGYNVVMLGRTATGTPKQLTLTPRVQGLSTGGHGRQQQTQQDEDNDDEVQAPPLPPETNAPQPPPQPPPQGNGPRTPQQMLQEMQQMRQQQLQQQQQQQPPQ
jgi:hypothetical protein